MEVSRALDPIPDVAPGPALQACPRCDEPASGLEPVMIRALGGVPLSRCHRCGTRVVLDSDGHRFVFTCGGCGFPFPAEELLPHDRQRCPDCREGGAAPGLPDDDLVAAMEREALAALATRWSFVTSPSLTAYLQRLVAQLEDRITGAPDLCRVVLVDDWSLRTLALPSGLVLVSLGTLAFLEDEAELAFVLAHEIAHAGSGDAALRLARLGYQAAASQGAGSDAAWVDALLDMARLGYGRVRERDADAVALDVILALGYDPVAVERYLSRVEDRVLAGAAEIAELAAAHPPANERTRRLDRALFGRHHREPAPKTNREVFRRAAGHQVLACGLSPLAPEELVPGPDQHTPVKPSGSGRLFWLVAGIGVVAAVILLVGNYLAG